MRKLVLALDRRPAAANWRVTSRDPHTIDLDSTLYSTDTKRHFVLGLYADCGDRLRLEHFRGLHLLPFVDFGILSEFIAVVPKLQ